MRKVRCLSSAGFHQMAYQAWGDPDNSRVLICVHGLTRNGCDFAPLAQALSGDYRVLCPDVVGRGKSDWLDTPKLYGYPQYMADMTALIARSGVDSVDWVGTSMGGFLGMLMAALPNSPINRLVMNDIGPFIPKQALARIVSYVGEDPRFPDRGALDAYMREIYAPFGPFTDEQWDAMVASTIRKTSDGDIGLAYDPRIVVPMRSTEIKDVDTWAQWDQVAAPTLVIRGTCSDLLSAETASEMTRRGPRAELLEIPDVGHAPSLMSSAQISAVSAFLSA